MSIRILVTGFEPFGGATRNPSGDAARALHGRAGSGFAVTGQVLPVLWDVAAGELLALVREVDPRVVLCLGMAQGTFRVERYADDARRASEDNRGRLPDPPRLSPTIRLPARLPVARVEAALAAAGAPVEASEDAGGFLCNEVFYALMSACHEGRLPGVRRAGFLHVPNDRHVPEAIPQAALEAAVMVALGAMLEDLQAVSRGEAGAGR